MKTRIGTVELAILQEVISAGGWVASISDHGPTTENAIDLLEAKNLLLGRSSGWRITATAQKLLSSRPLSSGHTDTKGEGA